MLITVAAKERTAAEYRALLASAGFHLTKIIPVGGVPASWRRPLSKNAAQQGPGADCHSALFGLHIRHLPANCPYCALWLRAFTYFAPVSVTTVYYSLF